MIVATFFTSYREQVLATYAINGVMPAPRRTRRVSYALLAIAAVGTLAGLSPVAMILVAFFPVVVLPIALLLPPYLAWLSRAGSPVWRASQRVVLGDYGFEHSAAAASGAIAWSSITRVAETGRFFLFFTSPQCAHYLPKRALDAADLPAVREYAERAGQPATDAPPAVAGDGGARAAEVPVAVAAFEQEAAQMYRAMRLVARYGANQWYVYVFMAALGAWTSGPPLVRQWRQGGIGNVSLFQLALGLTPLLLVLAIGPAATWWQVRRVLSSSPASRGPMSIAVTDGGVRASGASAESVVPWEAMHRAVETEEFFLFFITRVQAIYLPKPRLGHPSDAGVVRDLAARRLAARFTRVGA
jgi:YcxB-like protein